MKSTDEMVRKCFGEVWFTDGKGAVRHYPEIAKAARRFVRIEQREKAKKYEIAWENIGKPVLIKKARGE